jgi:hypothetical protein
MLVETMGIWYGYHPGSRHEHSHIRDKAGNSDIVALVVGLDHQAEAGEDDEHFDNPREAEHDELVDLLEGYAEGAGGVGGVAWRVCPAGTEDLEGVQDNHSEGSEAAEDRSICSSMSATRQA